MNNWENYHARVGDSPNPLTKKALGYVKYLGVALDLGAGNLRDSKHLMERGFKRVVAIDRKKPERTPRMLEFHEGDIAHYIPPANIFNLAISCNTLYFLKRAELLELIDRVYNSLRVDGIFACNLLGEQDSWLQAGHQEMDYLRRSDTELLRSKYTVLRLKEDEWDAPSACGSTSKHWHTWTLILRK